MLLWCSEAVIAQLAARRSHNPKVVSSILTHRMLSHSLQMEIFTLCLRHRNLRTLRSAKIFELMRRRDWLPSQAAIAQLGERQTEDPKVSVRSRVSALLTYVIQSYARFRWTLTQQNCKSPGRLRIKKQQGIRPRADLNRDRWIQSPECWPLHHEAE